MTGLAYLLADLVSTDRTETVHDAIRPDQVEQSILPERDMVEEPREIEGVDRDQQYPAEAAVGTGHPPSDLSRQFARDASDHRHAYVGLRGRWIKVKSKVQA